MNKNETKQLNIDCNNIPFNHYKYDNMRTHLHVSFLLDNLYYKIIKVNRLIATLDIN